MDSIRNSGSRIIYLDQHIWISFLQGLDGRDDVAAATFSALRSAVEDGSVIVPLSANHYLETWHRKSVASRHGLASLMKQLSNYLTFAPIHKIRRIEVERAILQRVGHAQPLPTPREKLLGYGVCHAFDSPTGRFRFVESLATRGVPEGPGMPPPELINTLNLTGDAWEWLNLAGPQEFIDREGIEITPEHRLGDEYVERQLRTRQVLSSEPLARKRIDDLMVMEELIEILPIVNDVCQTLQVDPRPWLTRDPSQGREFVKDIPTSVA